MSPSIQTRPRPVTRLCYCSVSVRAREPEDFTSIRFGCSVKSVAEAQSENWMFSVRQIEAFKNALVLICNLEPSSQAGRRGFEPRIPLHFSIT
jgi:hypothetical protein